MNYFFHKENILQYSEKNLRCRSSKFIMFFLILLPSLGYNLDLLSQNLNFFMDKMEIRAFPKVYIRSKYNFEYV